MKPLLVGECNSYQDNEEDAMFFAFHPDPPRASGGRLCYNILGLTEHAYLTAFDRTDLCWPKWAMAVAREKARRLVAERRFGDVIVLFGVKVATAFGLPIKPWEIEHVMNGPTLIYLPHPSGLNRVWYQTGNIDRARRLLRQVGVPCAPAVNG